MCKQLEYIDKPHLIVADKKNKSRTKNFFPTDTVNGKITFNDNEIKEAASYIGISENCLCEKIKPLLAPPPELQKKPGINKCTIYCGKYMIQHALNFYQQCDINYQDNIEKNSAILAASNKHTIPYQIAQICVNPKAFDTKFYFTASTEHKKDIMEGRQPIREAKEYSKIENKTKPGFDSTEGHITPVKFEKIIIHNNITQETSEITTLDSVPVEIYDPSLTSYIACLHTENIDSTAKNKFANDSQPVTFQILDWQKWILGNIEVVLRHATNQACKTLEEIKISQRQVVIACHAFFHPIQYSKHGRDIVLKKPYIINTDIEKEKINEEWLIRYIQKHVSRNTVPELDQYLQKLGYSDIISDLCFKKRDSYKEEHEWRLAILPQLLFRNGNDATEIIDIYNKINFWEEIKPAERYHRICKQIKPV